MEQITKPNRMIFLAMNEAGREKVKTSEKSGLETDKGAEMKEKISELDREIEKRKTVIDKKVGYTDGLYSKAAEYSRAAEAKLAELKERGGDEEYRIKLSLEGNLRYIGLQADEKSK